MRALAAEYGATAVRLWLLTIANLGVLYATNPSTISTFFDELTAHWRKSSSLIRNWCKDRKRVREQVSDLCSISIATHATPHYKVLLVGERNENVELESLAARCDELLSEINCEYRSKRASGRLGAVTFIETGTTEFAEQFSAHRGWESQFKFLPLCPHLIWNDANHVS